MKAKIYHNPRCSKSRETLSLLQTRGIEPEIVEYLKDPPDADEIRELLRKLDVPVADIVRTGETAFRESGLALESPPDDLIELIVAHPSVLQRPIVVVGNQARIGRPPEQVLELIS